MSRLLIALIVVGLLVFTGLAMFQFEGWVRAYGLWDKAKDFLAVLLIYDLSNKRYAKLFKPVLILLFIRLGWEVISWITGVNINNSYVVGGLFICYILYVLYQTIKNARS